MATKKLQPQSHSSPETSSSIPSTVFAGINNRGKSKVIADLIMDEYGIEALIKSSTQGGTGWTNAASDYLLQSGKESNSVHNKVINRLNDYYGLVNYGTLPKTTNIAYHPTNRASDAGPISILRKSNDLVNRGDHNNIQVSRSQSLQLAQQHQHHKDFVKDVESIQKSVEEAARASVSNLNDHSKKSAEASKRQQGPEINIFVDDGQGHLLSADKGGGLMPESNLLTAKKRGQRLSRISLMGNEESKISDPHYIPAVPAARKESEQQQQVGGLLEKQINPDQNLASRRPTGRVIEGLRGFATRMRKKRNTVLLQKHLDGLAERCDTEIAPSMYYDLVQDLLPILKETTAQYQLQLGEKHPFTVKQRAHAQKMESLMSDSDYASLPKDFDTNLVNIVVEDGSDAGRRSSTTKRNSFAIAAANDAKNLLVSTGPTTEMTQIKTPGAASSPIPRKEILDAMKKSSSPNTSGNTPQFVGLVAQLLAEKRKAEAAAAAVGALTSMNKEPPTVTSEATPIIQVSIAGQSKVE